VLPLNQDHLNQRTPHLLRWICRAILLDLVVLIALEVTIRMAAPVYARMWSDRDFTQGVAKAGRGYDSGNEVLRTPKPDNHRRIAFFGDSITYGFGLPVNETISAQVERVLNDGGKSSQWICVNMAGQGTSPIISYFNIKKDISSWNVDAVLYQFNMSDVGENPDIGSEEMFAEWLAAKRNQRSLRWWKSYQKSALYNFLSRETDTINYRIGGRKLDLKHWENTPYWRQLAARFDTDAVRAGWNRQFAALAQIEELCQRNGIAFMVIMLPYQFDMADGFPDNFWALDRDQFQVDPYEEFNRVAEQFNLEHAHYLETLRSVRQDMLQGKTKSVALYFPHDVGHLTVEGVGILAPALANDIRTLLE
jgi:hypothetical protein